MADQVKKRSEDEFERNVVVLAHGGTDRRIQRGLFPLRQGRRWHYHHQRTWNSYALPRTESNRSRTPGNAKSELKTSICRT